MSISQENASQATQDILVATQFASTGADFVDRIASVEAEFTSKLLPEKPMRALAMKTQESI